MKKDLATTRPAKNLLCYIKFHWREEFKDMRNIVLCSSCFDELIKESMVRHSGTFSSKNCQNCEAVYTIRKGNIKIRDHHTTKTLIENENSSIVAETFGLTLEKAEECAEYIVRSVNNFDALLEACKTAVNLCASYSISGVRVEKIKQAISNAEK